MAKLPVTQQDGEIFFTPGGVEPPRTYKVVKGEIEVEDADLAAVAQALAPGVGALTAQQLATATAGAEQAAYEQAKAAAENAQAVKDATAAGAARAAAESKKATKQTDPAG